MGVKYPDVNEGSLQSSSTAAMETQGHTHNHRSNSPMQKPFAAMSNLALSVVMAVRLAMASKESAWRYGSTHTSLQTSVILSSGWQLDICVGSTVIHLVGSIGHVPQWNLHQTQLVAVFDGVLPYRRAEASKQKPCSSSGRVVNQHEASCSFASSMAFFKSRWYHRLAFRSYYMYTMLIISQE